MASPSDGNGKTVRLEVECLGEGEETMRTQGGDTDCALRGEALWDARKESALVL